MYLLQHFSNILALRIKHNKVRKKRRTFTTFYFPDNFWQGLAQISHFTSRYISILWATLVYLYFMCPLFLEIHFRYSNLFSSYFPKYIFILHIYIYIHWYIHIDIDQRKSNISIHIHQRFKKDCLIQYWKNVGIISYLEVLLILYQQERNWRCIWIIFEVELQHCLHKRMGNK